MAVTKPPLNQMPEILDPSITFYEHQDVGIERMWNMKSFLLADDMGLGKSLQTLAVAAIHAHMTKQMRGTHTAVLIVCPPSLKRNWYNEIRRFTRFTPLILDGAPKTRMSQIADFKTRSGNRVLIANYEQIGKHLTDLNSADFHIVVADEAHYIKNPYSQRTKAFQKLLAPRRFLLTGTPMKKSVEDLWVLLNEVQPGQWGTFWGFCQKFAIYGGFEGKAVVGIKNEQQLTENLNRVMIRRLVKDVLDLPEVQFIRREVDLGAEQVALYNRAIKDMILERRDGEDGEEEISTPMVRFLRLSQICTTTATVREDGRDHSAKFDAAMVDLEDLIDAGRKVVVFTKFRGALEAYRQRIHKVHPGVPVFSLHGGVPIPDRQGIVDQWGSKPDAAVILCMIQVAGVGLNMTSASDVQFLDKEVTPADNDQAVARVHRIGQGGSVRVYEYHARGTIEARIDSILASKTKAADQVVENKSLQDLMNEALDEEER